MLSTGGKGGGKKEREERLLSVAETVAFVGAFRFGVGSNYSVHAYVCH